MPRRETTASSFPDSNDSTTKANVAQHFDFKPHNYSHQSSPTGNTEGVPQQQQSDDNHIYLISSNHNTVRSNNPRNRRYLQSMMLMKATILLVFLHTVSSKFDSFVSAPFLAGVKRKLTPQTTTTNPVKKVAVNFRQPRVIQVDSSFGKVQSLVNIDETSVNKSGQEIRVSERARKAKKSLENSYQYKKWKTDPKEEGCDALRDWQETSYVTCNKMHEVDFHTQASYLARGGLNAVFQMQDMDGESQIVKILRYKRDYTERNFDRVRRDSLVMERATKSKFVIDMYSFCGFSQIIEFGKDGGLDYWMEDGYDDLTQEQKLQIATQISQSLTDVHNLDGDGIPSMTHGDIAAKQYILIDGIFKLNDFNRGRLIQWNNKLKEPCPYTIRSNDGKFRSPEEYKYLPQTAAIDVYTLGSVFVEMVTGKEAWYGYEIEVAQKAIGEGMRPPLEGNVNSPTDPITQVLLKAIDLCYEYDPAKRPKASEITDFLKGEAKRLGVKWDKLFEGKRRNTLTTV